MRAGLDAYGRHDIGWLSALGWSRATRQRGRAAGALEVYIGLSKADAGQGLVAGLSIAVIAMVSDRIMRASVAKRAGASN